MYPPREQELLRRANTAKRLNKSGMLGPVWELYALEHLRDYVFDRSNGQVYDIDEDAARIARYDARIAEVRSRIVSHT